MLIEAIVAILALLCIGAAIAALLAYNAFRSCETTQSPYCYSVICPGAPSPNDPCRGYAHRYDDKGQLICAL